MGITKKKTTSALFLLLLSPRVASALSEDPLEDIPYGSQISVQPPLFWGGHPAAVEKWQSYLAKPDASGTFTLPGFNLSQPYSGAEPMDWTIKIAVRANMAEPGSDGPDQRVVTGGMVWIEPPEELVAGNYTANEEWNPFSYAYTSRGLSDSESDVAFTPFFHRDPGDDRPPDGSCDGILPRECIEFIEAAAEEDYINDRSRDHTIEDEEKCPSISSSRWVVDMASPFGFTRREQDGAAMEYDEGWLVSFTSALHAKGDNEMDYATHGSQYVPILFRWMREDTGDVGADEPKPRGRISQLLCVAVDEAGEGKELPDPGEEYLEAVKDREDGESGSEHLSPGFILVLTGIGVGLFGMT